MKNRRNTKSTVRYAIESVEFHKRGLSRGNESQIKIKRLTISKNTQSATASLEVHIHGEITKVKGQRYNVAGLQAWTRALANDGKNKL